MALSKDPGQATAQEFEHSLKDNAHQLVGHLENGDFAEALLVIHAINQARDRGLYHEVGQLTRALHNAIVNFQIDTSHALGGDAETSKISDASDRLDYVVQLTDKAANRTMDLVEVSAPKVSELGQQASALKADWQRLQRREMAADEFRDLYRRVGEFLDRTETTSSEVSAHLNDILIAQDYQDLTGQVIKRVITLVHDVEESLVSLVRMAGQVDRITGISHAEAGETKKTSSKGEGPQIHADKREDVVSGQDEVDDLLSSLGF
ncbi:protein phosphatase CheZ [Pseudomonas abyssi]|jgi:chemotaxis protein CheZ|uniref:Protein phosphatase n=2 Tax=Pseudomonas abyssi TaxID=170540 RepID=A0ACD6B4M8_9PSED|nr:protein phosphatase [Pseudomonadales bacterium]MAG67460.1 protein phosphatase [Pseudomonadales bacterium]PBK05714.1 protein phosphatase [Pseudomonas abyssi]RGP56511.1 protein phosphatase [Halopseudomonas gallaeciensis]|tara:strand:+ start:61134 stop:61925 length:792 start_codon:yes stop_codon:yes gene_type:complete